MPIKEVLTSQRVPVKIWTDDVDDKSKQQLANIASLPFIHHHVAFADWMRHHVVDHRYRPERPGH